MIRFECDYSEGAHPQILRLLTQTNLEQTPGYGTDDYSERARGLIRELCQMPEAGVHFMTGGTQANLTVIASVLRPHQGVVSANTGHISVHEAGAVEATGHKVLPLFSRDGKITAAQVEEAYLKHWTDVTHEHMVQPGMVYVSNPTENGTIYSKSELTALSAVCRSRGLPLFLDGARLGYGLAAETNDLTIADLAELCDVFTIGGTKVGALFGEAVVITNPALDRDFRYIIKQRGGMFAKGRLLGLQFIALLEAGLYFILSAHAVRLAMRLRQALTDKGFPLLYDSFTNQQFPILPDEALKQLAKNYTYSFWQKVDETHSAVRFCTSWATPEKDVELLIGDIDAL
jgi:threonine aldolase